MRISDWSSDVCSSDLQPHEQFPDPVNRRRPFTPGKPQDRAEDQRAQYALPQRYTKPEGEHASDRAAAITPFGGPFHHPVDHPGLRSEEHTSELQSLMRISYAVFCLKKKKKQL